MLWLGEILWDSGEVDGAQSPTSLQIFRAKGEHNEQTFEPIMTDLFAYFGLLFYFHFHIPTQIVL